MIDLLVVIDASHRDAFDKLTLHRTPGALPFAGKYRLIDFTLSNIKNAGVINVAIFPLGNYRSMQDHVGSGKRWNLDRRNDGLFILPPKNRLLRSEDMLSFQRMHEHIEYFKRSPQKYVMITPPSIVWNVDLKKLVDAHIEAGADISEVMHGGKRLKTFIIERKLLLDYILEYDMVPYKTLKDLVLNPKINKHMIEHTGYTIIINNPYTYLKCNLDMLKFEIGSTIFSNDAPIISKEKPAPPAFYGNHALIMNSMVASGSLIYGHIEDSIIGRDTIIQKKSVVKNSVIMNNSVIEEGVQLNNVILDKGTVVKKNTVLEGSQITPFVTQKEQIITDHSGLKVLMVASEVHPYAKTGGLADITGGLSRALSKRGIDVSVVIPLYKSVKDNYHESYQLLTTHTVHYKGERREVRIHVLYKNKVKYYFLENFKYFERPKLYGYEDDCERYAFFNIALEEIMDSLDAFDLLHLHDWQAALMPVLMKVKRAHPLKTVLTIHNIDYQGICSPDVLSNRFKHFESATLNFLEIGIAEATRITTVSPTYREELRHEYYAKNLTYSLSRRDRDFYGILNGLSNKHRPTNDPLILSQYDANDTFAKTENKLFLQKKMKLFMGVNCFVVAMVSRITEQKGFNLVVEALDGFLSKHDNVQFVLLGTGDKTLIEQLKQLREAHPKQVSLNIGYDSTVPNYLYAGADLFLMPSRVEPCGLSQMIAMRYGTLPLVHKTGGLADSVEPFDPISKQGTGFMFDNFEAEVLENTLESAYYVYLEEKDVWKKMIKRAMQTDFSLDTQAQKMLEIYQTLFNKL
jgi:starch synthase